MRTLPTLLPTPPFVGSLALLTCVPWLLGTATAQCSFATSFSTNSALPAATQSAVVLFQNAADLDGDGFLDLVVVRAGQNIALQRNDGTGHFTSVAAPPLDSSRRYAVADFDLDGRVDLLTGKPVPTGSGTQWDFEVAFWRNTTTTPGTPTFALAASRLLGVLTNQAAYGDLLVSDVDADGIPDALVVRNGVTTLHGAGAHGTPSGQFGTVSVSPGSGGISPIKLLFDVDQDHVPDVITGSGLLVQVQLGLVDPTGRPTGDFGAPTQRVLGGTDYAATAGDVDGDGFVDIVSTNQQHLTIRRGLPGFQFAAPVVVPVTLGETPFLGDFDRDGALEICLPRGTQYWNMNLVFVDDPLGAASVSLQQIGPGYPVNGVAADFDADGRLDFAVGKDSGEVVCGLGTCPAGVAPQVTVLSPNGGEQWLAGALQTVQWLSAGAYATFDVEVSADAGLTWRALARDVHGTSCQVRATEPSCNTALVRVRPSGMPMLGDASDAWFSIGGPGLAAAVPFGQGCGAPTGLTTFTTPPRFGANLVAAVGGAVPGVPVALWLSLPAAVPLPLLPGCALHLDLATLSLLAVEAADPSGHAGFMQSVPIVPQAIGLDLIVQPVAFASAPVAAQFGNPVRLTLGY